MVSTAPVGAGKLLPFSERLCLVRLRADSIRPYKVRAKQFDIRSFFLLYFSKRPLSISPCVFPQTVIPYPCNMEKRGNFHERTGNY